MGKQLVNFITCGCESSAPFCNLQSRARTHAVLVIGLYDVYDVYDWATRALRLIDYESAILYIDLLLPNEIIPYAHRGH